VTGGNRSRNAAEELARAETCLREARALLAANLPYGATARAYYVVFHGARALLFSVGLEASTHKGVISLLGEHFVRPGRLPSTLGRLVSRMQRDREDADYSTGAVFTSDDAAQAIGDAERFLGAARDLITPPPA
jgi:uncharacterized protein (UPF0332 family)